MEYNGEEISPSEWDQAEREYLDDELSEYPEGYGTYGDMGE